jgi:hypothetical protein
MKIKGEATIAFIESSISHELILTVKFKIPNKFFKVTRKKRLHDSWWQVYNSYNHFLDECLHTVSDKEYLIQEAKNMILDYFNRETKDLLKEDKKKEINRIVNELNKNKFEVEVEIK